MEPLRDDLGGFFRLWWYYVAEVGRKFVSVKLKWVIGRVKRLSKR